MKNSSDNIGNRTRNLLACSAVPQPTAPPRAPIENYTTSKPLNVSLEKPQIFSCDTLVANE
jgi:hypothetical protein